MTLFEFARASATAASAWAETAAAAVRASALVCATTSATAARTAFVAAALAAATEATASGAGATVWSHIISRTCSQIEKHWSLPLHSDWQRLEGLGWPQAASARRAALRVVTERSVTLATNTAKN